MRTVYRAQAVEARRALALCWAFLLAVVVASWISALTTVGDQGISPLITVTLGTAAVLLFVRLQLAACRGGRALAQPWIAPVIVLLTGVPLLWSELIPTSMVVLAAVLIQRDLRVALAEALVVGVVLAWAYERSDMAGDASFFDLIAEVAMFTAVLVAVTRLAVLLDSLRFNRELLARRRVDLERERIGRDLHDIMGRTFVAASLRNQAAVREVGDGDPEGAARLDRLHDTIAKGQLQLRSLTSGPTITRLEDELETSRELCERVSVQLRVEVRVEPPPAHDALAALAVREVITNVLKHSRATTCSIRFDRTAHGTELVLTNDGATDDGRDTSEDPESRLERAVVAAGGTSRVDRPAPGLYRTTVRIPLTVTAAR